jgi:hypothetical protein
MLFAGFSCVDVFKDDSGGDAFSPNLARFLVSLGVVSLFSSERRVFVLEDI